MSTALADPVDRVGKGWTASLSLANVAIWVGWYGPLQILLARQAEDFAPGTGMSKETRLTRLAATAPTCANAASRRSPGEEGPGCQPEEEGQWRRQARQSRHLVLGHCTAERPHLDAGRNCEPRHLRMTLHGECARHQ